MAYLHCHKCGWSQDDFWDFSFGKHRYFWHWGYNPISLFLLCVFGKKGYLKPRRIKFDSYVAKEYGWKRIDPHTWYLVWYELCRTIKKFKRQKWWTNRAFRKDKNAICPKCKSDEGFDID